VWPADTARSVSVRASQQVGDGASLGMDLPMGDRCFAHVRSVLKSSQRRAIQHRVDGHVGPHGLQVATAAICAQIQRQAQVREVIAVDKYRNSSVNGSGALRLNDVPA